MSHWSNSQTNPLDPNLLFAGQYYDEESQLAYNRFRYYDPETGSYLTSDPIGLNGGEQPYRYTQNPMDWVDVFGLAGCKVKRLTSRNRAIQEAKEFAQVQRNSRGGRDISLERLNPSSRGKKWNEMKANGAKKLGRENPNGKNYWVEHPDGHPDAGLPGIPQHHSGGHIHAVNPKGEEMIFTWG